MDTEIGARVGVGPVGVFVVAMTAPDWIGEGTTAVPFTGAKGSYVGYAIDGALVQDENKQEKSSKIIIRLFGGMRVILPNAEMKK